MARVLEGTQRLSSLPSACRREPVLAYGRVALRNRPNRPFPPAWPDTALKFALCNNAEQPSQPNMPKTRLHVLHGPAVDNQTRPNMRPIAFLLADPAHMVTELIDATSTSWNREKVVFLWRLAQQSIPIGHNRCLAPEKYVTSELMQNLWCWRFLETLTARLQYG